MPDEVIAQVESLAGDDGGPDSFTFLWGNHTPPIDPLAPEDGFLPAPTGVGYRSRAHRHTHTLAPRAPNPFAALADNDDAGMDMGLDAAQPGAAVDVDEYDSSDGEYENDSEGSTGVDADDDVLQYDTEDDGTVTADADDDADHAAQARLTAAIPNAPPNAAAMDAVYGPRQHGRDLRPRKPRDFGHLFDLSDTVLTQYNVKAGLQKFGAQGSDAVTTELKQLHDRAVMQPVFSHSLSREEKQRSLAYLMFLKQKRSGKIKGRGCADGRKQRLYKNKADVSSPTVAIESVMLSCAIDAKEGRDVATCDVPGAFMQTDIDELIHVRMDGELAELMVKIDPALYEQYMVRPPGKKPVIYMVLNKALYGTLQAALLFWKDLSGALQEWGYSINPYDRCVANKIVNGHQHTVLWHVDDLKLSHVDSNVNTDLLDQLNQRYGTVTPLVITRGKIHEYLGMTLDFSKVGKCVIRMDDYVANLLEAVPDDMKDDIAETPAADHLFTVNPSAKRLDRATRESFHSLTAQLLFLSRRARPEIQTAVSFLCTRTQAPDDDDYKKLRRVMLYLRRYPTLALTLEAHNLRMVKWSIDASFAVHDDMRSHTGGCGTLGGGAFYAMSSKQKLNTRSSTEAELVGVDDMMGKILWTQLFLKGQGYDVGPANIAQDNMSAMLLEKNGIWSSTKRTRHLDIRYFFVTDRISKGDVMVEYCPTGDMISDLLTKPLQGAAFRKFRALLLNLDSEPSPHPAAAHRSVLELAHSRTTTGLNSKDGYSHPSR
jgi:hypothetical protein